VVLAGVTWLRIAAPASPLWPRRIAEWLTHHMFFAVRRCVRACRRLRAAAEDKYGRTAADYAQLYKHDEAYQLLVDAMEQQKAMVRAHAARCARHRDRRGRECVAAVAACHRRRRVRCRLCVSVCVQGFTASSKPDLSKNHWECQCVVM
jgi:hypothetical protein